MEREARAVRRSAGSDDSATASETNMRNDMAMRRASLRDDR
jgi:hypothetical protein